MAFQPMQQSLLRRWFSQIKKEIAPEAETTFEPVFGILFLKLTRSTSGTATIPDSRK